MIELEGINFNYKKILLVSIFDRDEETNEIVIKFNNEKYKVKDIDNSVQN